MNGDAVRLPDDFRLLVQIEEVLDVSVNAEKRLAQGPSDSAAPSAVGNQNHRCLKFCYSVGYYSNGSSCNNTAVTDENDTTTPTTAAAAMVAMEITPIPSISANSLAGLKVLLAGPIVLRFGVAGWHAGNATVLGGACEHLVQIQKVAIRTAQQKAGHGVDPTVKALIWNNHQDVSPDEDDQQGTSLRLVDIILIDCYILYRFVLTVTNLYL